MRLKNIFRGEKIFNCINTFFLITFSFIIIIPFWTVIMNSFVSEMEIMRRGVFILLPEEWNFDAYQIMLGRGSNIYRAYGNTIFVVSLGTAMNLAFTITLAYGLSKRKLKGRGIITGLIFFTMLFNGGLIPNYMLVKFLGLINSRFSLIFPGLIGTWNMFIMRNFFYAIPESLEEAAFIDGANPVHCLIKIVLPLSLPAIATIGLFYAVWHWNDWFSGLLYINDVAKLPVQNVLRNIIAVSNISDVNSYIYDSMLIRPPSQSIRAAAVVICTLPILVVYPFIQKYFVKGVMVGSIKG